jgi:hypothetical protein
MEHHLETRTSRLEYLPVYTRRCRSYTYTSTSTTVSLTRVALFRMQALLNDMRAFIDDPQGSRLDHSRPLLS